MKPSDIREFTEAELARALEDNRREQFNLGLQAQTGQLENVARLREVRRDIARLMTEKTARAKSATA